ncbi:DUF4062 domain-containing protein [Qipengyuania atrilutea]|uniref:DUF4062 domain-containing protein n=1 Tax=Qipengyuania atrilutea TaxID=2744473 RepID=A0A850H593_9SPHN|nr:DUF4062 domain-containing protein [Actirhodobacter atriluteus]NVD45830.1 DUF4062 domain-containing protein [Actirhodobacter atriluteus]
MAFHSQVITIFVSSPGDVSEDRRLVLDEIQSWNQRNARDRGCFLTAMTWEDLVSPDIAESSQNVINVEVGDDYDVFLGLMWGRFGTPTLNANSGTEEEFERALARKIAGDALRISFLFRKSDLPFDQIDPEQIAKVREFQKSLRENGAFYRQYSDERELVSTLTTLFDRIATEKERYATKSTLDNKGGPIQIDPDLTSGDEEPSADTELDPDAGLLDLEDELTEYASLFVSELSQWGNQFYIMNEVVQQATSKMNGLSQFGQPDREALRNEVELVTSALSDFANFGKNKIALIEDNLEGMYRSMSGIATISHGFDMNRDQIEHLTEQLNGLRGSVDEADGLLTQYIDVMEGLPRIEKGFNRARSGVVTVHKQLRKKLRDFRDRLVKVCSELNSQS